jgi:hypothetical protein
MVSEETGLREIKIEANNITPSTFVAWLRRQGAQSPRAAAAAHRKARRSVDQKLRRAVHQNRVLSVSRRLVNHVVSRTGLGDTLVGWFQKPAS